MRLENLKNNLLWNEISLLEKYILLFEVSKRCSSFLYFNTTGLDPLGVEKIIKKASKKFLLASLAGVLGIEPSLIVLETTVLPIYDTPKYKIYYILCYT